MTPSGEGGGEGVTSLGGRREESSSLIERITQAVLEMKCQLASLVIASGYPVHALHDFNSDKVLGRRGYPHLRWGCSERTPWPADRNFL